MTSPKYTVVAEPDRALVFDGHALTRAQALTQAREHLVTRGKRAFDIDEALVDRQGLVVQAHWAGEGIGFCGEQHPRAQPVTVVNLPGDMAQSAQGAGGPPPRGTATTGGRS